MVNGKKNLSRTSAAPLCALMVNPNDAATWSKSYEMRPHVDALRRMSTTGHKSWRTCMLLSCIRQDSLLCSLLVTTTALFEYYRQALEIRENVLGPFHPDTATSCNKMGGALARKGYCDGSLKYFRKALEIDETAGLVYGLTHPDTVGSYNNIGIALARKGDYKGAIEYHRKALEIRKSVLGLANCKTASSYFNIGGSLLRKATRMAL